MAIVSISRGFYRRGKEIAEQLAGILGYECIFREIILESSEQFNISEIKLARAIHDAPSVLGRFPYGRERYIAFFKRFQKDNLVYHGLAGFFQFVFGLARMGILMNFVSYSVIVGFTASASILIATSQLKYVSGILLPSSESFFADWMNIIREISGIKPYALIVAAENF